MIYIYIHILSLHIHIIPYQSYKNRPLLKPCASRPRPTNPEALATFDEAKQAMQKHKEAAAAPWKAAPVFRLVGGYDNIWLIYG